MDWSKVVSFQPTLDWTALATVALAAAVFLQIRSANRTTKQQQRREVADRVYSPVLRQIHPWRLQGYLDADFTVPCWSQLKVEASPASYFVPPRIMALLGQLEDAGKAVLKSRGPAASRLQAVLEQAAIPLKEGMGKPVAAPTTILCSPGGLDSGFVGGGTVDLRACWLNNMTIDDWARYHFEPQGRSVWTFQVFGGLSRIGGDEAARNLATQVSNAMAQTSEGAAFKAAAQAAVGAAEAVTRAMEREQRRLRA